MWNNFFLFAGPHLYYKDRKKTGFFVPITNAILTKVKRKRGDYKERRHSHSSFHLMLELAH